MIDRPPFVRAAICLTLTAAIAAACAGPAPTSTAAQDLSGAHVRVLGLWSGPELDSFVAVKAAWETATGASVDWEGAQDLAARLRAGTPPDIAILPNPGLLQQLAREGKLIPLDTFMDPNQIRQDYAPAWIDLGSYAGRLYALFYKVANKATVWYNPRAFAAANYSVPKTWPEMLALADTMVAAGRTPFSIVAPSGPGSGWALTDWVSAIVLNNCGPDLYDAWIAGEIPWTEACLKQSFALFAQLVQTEGYVRGGRPGLLATTDAEGTYPLYTEPPTAYMDFLASFAQGFIAAKYPHLTPGEDYDFFPFPTINPEYAGAVTVGADSVVMVTDTPAARSFLTYLAGAPAQAIWIKLGGFTSVNRSVSPDTYLDPVARAVARELAEARLSRFGAGDLLPAALQKAWWKAMLELVKDPSRLEAILESLTRAAEKEQ